MSKQNPIIPLFDLNYTREEEEAVSRVLRSKWLTMGQETEALEEEFAQFCGVKYAIAVSSCTTALHLANLAVGIREGSKVICPALSFVATSNSIIYAGGSPVFADLISLNDWTISPEDVEQLTSLLTQRKSSGQNFIGAWESGTASPIRQDNDRKTHSTSAPSCFPNL